MESTVQRGVVLTRSPHPQRHITMDITQDSYTEKIELSNRCRAFYQNRLATADVMKKKLESLTTLPVHPALLSTGSTTVISTSSSSTDRRNGTNSSTDGRKSTLEQAMHTLRTEVLSLMDQNMSLMKQMLTLNETIEDIKWQQRCGGSHNSESLASCEEFSDTDMFEESDNDITIKHTPVTITTTVSTIPPLTGTPLINGHQKNISKSPSAGLTEDFVIDTQASDLSSLIKDYDTMLKLGHLPTYTSTLKRDITKTTPLSSPVLGTKLQKNATLDFRRVPDTNGSRTYSCNVQITKRHVDKGMTYTGQSLSVGHTDQSMHVCHHSDQSSFDSGIHSDEDRTVVS